MQSELSLWTRAADHVRGVGTQSLQEQLGAGGHGRDGHGRRCGRLPVGTGGEVPQVLVFGVAQAKSASEGVDGGGAGAGLRAVLAMCVVVVADPGEGGHFLAAQAGRAAQPSADRQTDVVGCHRERRARGKRPSSVPPLPPLCCSRAMFFTAAAP